MGCGPSTEAAAVEYAPKRKENPQETARSTGIDRELDRARQNEELKVKLLLLGAGESGKSTIFKQMRILHGSPRNEDEQRMYGVVVRSNVITAMRKLCTLLKTLHLEEQLAAEPLSEDKGNGTGLTPKQAYDVIVAHVIEGSASPEDLPKPDLEKDWVGNSPRAGLGANNDAQQFLQLWRHIKTLWEVRLVQMLLLYVATSSFLRLLTHPSLSLSRSHTHK